MSVYTKTGDAGITSLYTGERVSKNSLRVKTYGTVDELNSALAMARAASSNERVKEIILGLQKNNNLLMADLASKGQKAMINDESVAAIEKMIDEVEEIVPPFSGFIIPGDTLAGAFLDLARTITRRAERRMLDMAAEDEVHESNRLYINRLSDLCFVLMRMEENR